MGWSMHTSPCGKSWLLCVPNCVIVVVWLSVVCVPSWMFYGLVCAHIFMWKELVAFSCVPNCVFFFFCCVVVSDLFFSLVFPCVSLCTHLHVERAGCFVVCS